MKKFAPACLLFFLAPAIGELLSGSAPPAEFFNPLGFVVLCVLYGGGAIIVRELKIRWRKGWPSLLLLGAAYGIVEEGLMVKSFFDPGWMDLGILATYGRWLGVNWVWGVELTIYHAVISIAIPICLVELVFPQQRSEKWVGTRALGVLITLFLADVAFGYLLLTSYRPSLAVYLPTIGIVACLVLLAKGMPERLFSERGVIAKNPLWFWLIGFLGTIAFFVVFWALPHTDLPAPLTIVLGILLVAAVTWSVKRISGNGFALADKHKLALSAGPLSVFILLSPIHEFDPSRTDDASGMIVVGLVALAFLIWLWWWVKRRDPSIEKTE